MKIYTRTGDDGTTARIGGGRVKKSDPFIDAYGALDELNSSLGFSAVTADSTLIDKLQKIQSDLFAIGSNLATPAERLAAAAWIPTLADSSILRLESQIDAAESGLQELKNFILPGGSETASRLHLARAACRRAERTIVALPPGHPSAPFVIRYLNRLSDWLFVHARLANRLAGIPDIPWLNPGSPNPS